MGVIWRRDLNTFEEEKRIEDQIFRCSIIEMPGRRRRRMKISDSEAGQ